MSFLCSKPFQISPLYPNLKPKHFKFQIVTTWFIIAPSYTHMKHFPYPFSDCVFFRICSSLSNLPSLTSSPRLLVHCDTATLPFPQLHSHVHRSYTLQFPLPGHLILDLHVSHCLTLFSDTFSTRPSLTPPFISTTLPNPQSQHSSSSFSDYIFLINYIHCT